MLKGTGSTIRSQLTLLVFACVVPASLAAAALVFYNYYENRARLLHEAKEVANVLMAAVDRELAAQQAALSVLATSSHLRTNNLAAFYRQAQETLKYHRATNIVLLDPTYQQRINTLRPFGSPLPLTKDGQVTRRVFETGRPTVSDVFIGPVAQKPLVSISVPVFEKGKVIYVLGTGVWSERLRDILLRERLPAGWIGTIFDSKGAIVARTHEMERFVGQNGSPALIKRMSEVSEDSLETVTVEGIPVISTFTRSSVSNWGVALGIPLESFSGPLRRSMLWLMGGIALLFIGSLIVAFAIAVRLTRSVGALREPALALGRGEIVHVPDLRLKEVNEVGQALVKAYELLSTTKHRATHDPLTGLANRMLFAELLGQQLKTCQRTGRGLSVLYIDVDRFKSINDKYGHQAGDGVLRMLATTLKAILRGSDAAARLGGDEFAIMLVDTDIDGARVVAQKLFDAIAAREASPPEKPPFSISIGIAVYPTSGSSAEMLIHRADEAMYQAKAAGNQRGVVADS